MSLMVDWFYSEAGDYPNPDYELWLRLINPELHRPTKDFTASIDRMHDFWELAPRLGEILSTHMAEWMRLMLGHDRLIEFASDSSLERFMQATQKEFRERLRRKEEAFTKENKDPDAPLKAVGFDRTKAILKFDRFVREYGGLESAIRAVFDSQITLTWTAFETLAEDLWGAIVGAVPRLASVKGYFRRLESIRKTYSHLNRPEIDALLGESILRILNLVRNLIVHKTRRVDQIFLTAAQEVLWDPPVKVNDELILNGKDVKRLISPTIQLSEKLIRAVDVWIATERKTGS